MDYERPWVEKYRPQQLSEITGNDRIVQTLQHFGQQGNIPNLLLSGPPGTGKTTSVKALASQMLGKDQYKLAVLELNASDERGIDVVRESIKSFAMKYVQLPAGCQKIVILDEADSMTEGAQQALRMIMSEYSNTTRFAFACNDSAKIIDALQSRCSILRFTKLGDTDIITRIQYIAQSEDVLIEKQGLDALVFTAEGDMRNAINNLQATAAANNKQITQEAVFKVCDQPHPQQIKLIIQLAVQSDFREACRQCSQLRTEGFSNLDIVSQMYKVSSFLPINEISQNLKMEYMKLLTILKLKVMDGLSSQLQMDACIAEMCQESVKCGASNAMNIS